MLSRRSGMRFVCLLASIQVAPSGGFVLAASVLSESAATAKAIAILRGDHYGTSDAEVKANIKQAQLLQDGKTRACGPVKGPVWEFRVVAVTENKDQFNNGVIDGYLALDALTGKIRCANLPLLD